MLKGTPIFAGFYSTTQRPIEEAYLNNGTPWADAAEVLTNVPAGARYKGMLVNIGYELHWFLEDLTTIQPVKDTLIQTAEETLIEDVGTFFTADNVEGALQEIGATLKLLKNPYIIELQASGDVADYLVSPVVPVGWSLSVSDGTDLVITHNLIDRELAQPVAIKEINGGTNRFCIPFEEAYTGVTETGNAIKIEGINTPNLPLKIYLFFS